MSSMDAWEVAFVASGAANVRSALRADIAGARRADCGQPQGERKSGHRSDKLEGLLSLHC